MSWLLCCGWCRHDGYKEDEEPNEEAAMQALKKPPGQRSLHDLEVLVRWIPTLHVKVFEELSADALRSLCSQVLYEVMEPKHVVFRQGDPYVYICCCCYGCCLRCVFDHPICVVNCEQIESNVRDSARFSVGLGK